MAEGKTRAAQYAAVLGASGLRMEDCTVLRFIFGGAGAATVFFYALMQADAGVVLYDMPGADAYVVVRRGAEARVRAIAAQCGGREDWANLY